MPGAVLPRSVWLAQEADHHRRVDHLVSGFLQRRSHGRSHPVEDFLFVYYQHRPGRLRRWHPGPGVVLAGASDLRGQWPYYRSTNDGVQLDLEHYLARRAEAVRFVRDLLAATAARSPQWTCFGLHEWAMVYRDPQAIRHAGWPLRLGNAQTDAVLQSLPLRCTHADAYRFFTPAAAPLNAGRPVRATQLDTEQPGCLHATMDLYKWAFKLSPGIPSELTMACFELARQARELDMRAAPYDLSAMGYRPVRVETAAGRVEYVQAQRAISAHGARLRARLLAACEGLLAGAGQAATSHAAAGQAATSQAAADQAATSQAAAGQAGAKPAGASRSSSQQSERPDAGAGRRVCP